jgi:hypothetical protein
MARFDDDDQLDMAGLRVHLLAGAVEFRELVAHPVCPGQNGQPVLNENGELRRYPLNAELWAALSPAVDGLADGHAYRFPRGDLPDGHPAHSMGGAYEVLELGADDVLRLVVAK